MNIIQVGQYWIGFLPGKLRVPGQFKLRSQAIKAYQDFIKLPRVIEDPLAADSTENIQPAKPIETSLTKLEQARSCLDIFSAVPKQVLVSPAKPKGKPGRPKKIQTKHKR